MKSIRKKTNFKSLKRTIYLLLLLFPVFTFLYQVWAEKSKIPFNSYIVNKSIQGNQNIASVPSQLTDTYKKHWINHNLSLTPNYCTLCLVNNSNIRLVQCRIKFEILIDDKSPLNEDYVFGTKKVWTQSIQVIEKDSTTTISIIDISPFYSGNLKWQIEVDDPYKANSKKCISKGNYIIDNKKKLTF